MIEETEFSKDLIATQTRNLKPVTITLTAIEVFAVVSAVQFAESIATAKEVRSQGARHPRSHPVSNQTDSFVYEFDS